ncbi:Protein DEK, partial [Orchesella cincta]
MSTRNYKPSINASLKPIYLRLLVFIFLIADISAQKLCKFSSGPTFKPNNESIFIQNFSAAKCLKVEGFGILPNSNVVLEECTYWKTATKDQKYQFETNSLNKTFIKMNPGNGEDFCLTITKGSSLKNVQCSPMSFDQSWTVKPVQGQPGQFLIEQYSSKKCLKPVSSSTGSKVQLSPCNSHQTEQIWKFCKKQIRNSEKCKFEIQKRKNAFSVFPFFMPQRMNNYLTSEHFASTVHANCFFIREKLAAPTFEIVDGSLVVLPEVEVKKPDDGDGDTSVQDPVAVITSPNKTVVVDPVTSKESSEYMPNNMEKENEGSQGAPTEEQQSVGEEVELNSGNDAANLDLLDLLAGPSERVKIGAFSRRRKHRKVFVFEAPEERPPIVVEKGEGCKLVEIPSIEAQINKRPYSDLVRLHRLIFGKPGSHEEIKTNLKLFSGFTFGIASDEYQKKKDALLMMNEIVRDVLCDCLAMDKSGEKNCVAENIMNFLMKPTGAVFKQPSAEEEDSKAVIEKDNGNSADVAESDSTVASEEQVSQESNVSVATPEKLAAKKRAKTAASKPRKAKPKKEKENKPLKDQDKEKPAQRKRKGFNAPTTDKPKPPKQIKSKSKLTDKNDKSASAASIE